MDSGLSPAEWEAFLARYPESHLLQTTAWGEVKARFGWDVLRLASGESGAQVLFRHLPLGMTLAYVPKGPLGPWLPGLLPELDAACRARRAFALKVEPDTPDDPERQAALRAHAFAPSRQPIQPRRTLVVDLDREEGDLLSGMHPKTRYNIRLAERKGVRVHPWDDLEAFSHMLRATATRDGFAAHTPGYYRLACERFRPQGACELLVAEAEGAPLAALMVFARGRRAWYLYGASSDLERNRMPTYLLQWEAMRWARARGCTTYDLWGVPDADLETLEAGFTSRADGLWGVYRFKRGFGGRLVRTLGAWDRAYNRPVHLLYQLLIASRSAE